MAAQTGRDPKLCQTYIDESQSVVRTVGRAVVTRHRLGFDCIAAGVDKSNVASQDLDLVSLLPRDPDRSATQLRDYIGDRYKRTIAVVVSDSLGRKGRLGSVGAAIGVAGLAALEIRKQADLFGRNIESRIAVADQLAAAAAILMGQGNEGYPVILIRGAPYARSNTSTIADLMETSQP